MTDRELLEAAAKAAGYWSAEFDCPSDLPRPGWDPLADDGDALRLAVKLGIQIRQYPIYDTPRFAAYACSAKWSSDAERMVGPEALVKYEGDPCAATRRAIVRAAAAMVKQERVT